MRKKVEMEEADSCTIRRSGRVRKKSGAWRRKEEGARKEE